MWQLAGAVVVVLFLYVATRELRRGRERKRALPTSQPIVHEYWIWTQFEDLPEPGSLRKRLHQSNPHVAKFRTSVTSGENLRWWGDIRVHLGLSARAKNPHIFEPRFFTDEARIPSGAEEVMGNANAVAIVRFTSDTLTPNRDYLQFLTFLADAVAEMLQSELIYDRECMRFWFGPEWPTVMMRDEARQDCDKTVRLDEVEEPTGWWIHTHGLRKYGLPDLEMTDVPREQHIGCLNTLSELMRRVLDSPDELKDGEVELFGRPHRFVLTPGERGARHHRGVVVGVVDTTAMIDQIVYEQ